MLAPALALLVAAPPPAACAPPPPAAEPTTLEEILVVVNGHIITRKSFQLAVEQQLAELYRMFSGKELDERLEGAREKTLQELIDTYVLLDVATEKELLAFAPTEGDFLDDLKKRSQIASEAELERMIRSELGLSLGEFIRQQRQTYVVEALLYQEVYRKVPVEEQEARLYYNEHLADYRQAARFRVRELVIPKAAGHGDGPGAAETLEKVREGLRDGAPFEDLVRRYSGSLSGPLGGDLGWADKGILLPAIEDAALALAPDEVSDVIETDKDYIIIQLMAREDEGARPFEAVRGQIAAKLQEPKAKNALQLYLQAQRLRANIRYMVPKEQIVKG